MGGEGRVRGTGMGTGPATIIIEPRLLVREALELLMGSHSYRVVCGFGSIADIAESPIVADGPELVILGTQSTESAVSGADSIRRLWPGSKIILLFDYASPADFQKLLTSQIDGCVPSFVSPNTLVSTLDLVVTRDVRVMVVGDTKRSPYMLAQREEPHRLGTKKDGSQLESAEQAAVPITIVGMRQPELPAKCASDLNIRNGDTQCAPKLSEREAQILDGLVKGQANKVIARTCDITEATVKVHMKSILRKIRVRNRTQAAIWALGNGYPGEELEDHAAKGAAMAQNTAH